MIETTEYKPPVESAIAGRSCGSCTLCCKVLSIPWLNKASGAWCKDCNPGKGCKIWESRPQGCRDFLCQYFFIKDIGEDWRPDRAKFLLNMEKGDTWLVIHAEISQPDAWKREPYGSTIRRWADYQMERGKGIMLYVGAKQFIVTPDSEVPIHEYPKSTKFQLLKVTKNVKAEYHVNILPPVG